MVLFHQYGKEGLLPQLEIEDLFSAGHQAPKLLLPAHTALMPLNSLVVFYESGCNSCDNELLHLRGLYPQLQEKNIRVISVSADKDEAVYWKNAEAFPWDVKICDFQGFAGVNFKNYDIFGTPVIFLIDNKGVITGKYAQILNIKL
jgi:peroxiredoxin